MDLQALDMHTPSSCQREEESVRDDFGQSVGNGLCALLFDFHTGGEGADFEGVGTGEGICGVEGHGAEDRLFELLGCGREGGYVCGGVEGV